jgi:hypothetical protein
MKVMIIAKASVASEAGEQMNTEQLAAVGAYIAELLKAGILIAGDGLYPSRKGKRVRFSGKDLSVVDGPFAETKELIAGYWIWNVNDMEDAVAWLKRCPIPNNETTEFEIRPVFETDFGEAIPPEQRVQGERVFAEAQKTKT